MTKVILVRHGETEWCAQKRIRGSIDIPLNNEGEKEAQAISRALSKHNIKAVYSSPAACSLATASEIAAHHKVKVHKLPDLKELNLGLWQGLLLKDIKRRYKKQYSTWRNAPTSAQPPGGESTREAYDRALSAMHKLIDKNKDNDICVVSGSITLSIIKCHLKNMNLEEMWKSIPEKTWWETLNI